jgi:transposase
MPSLPVNVEVCLCAAPVDLRKGFDGLAALVETVFQRSVLDGPLFLFINRRRDRLKGLWWDRGGLTIWYRRLEMGCFELPKSAAGLPHVTLDATALAMLQGGVPLATRRRRRYSRAARPAATLDGLVAGTHVYESIGRHVWKQSYRRAVRQTRVEERWDTADRKRFRRARGRIQTSQSATVSLPSG